jgi:hypothetical protein
MHVGVFPQTNLIRGKICGIVEIFHKQIGLGERGDREFPYFPALSRLKPRKITV